MYINIANRCWLVLQSFIVKNTLRTHEKAVRRSRRAHENLQNVTKWWIPRDCDTEPDLVSKTFRTENPLTYSVAQSCSVFFCFFTLIEHTRTASGRRVGLTCSPRRWFQVCLAPRLSKLLTLSKRLTSIRSSFRTDNPLPLSSSGKEGH